MLDFLTRNTPIILKKKKKTLEANNALKRRDCNSKDWSFRIFCSQKKKKSLEK